MAKIDPYKHEQRYRKWQEDTKNGIPGISKRNSEITRQYITDMEHGLNVSAKSVKGGRSYIRLNSLREKLLFYSRKFKEIYDIDDITTITEEQILLFFSKMRRGEIRRIDGKKYLSINHFTKIFKAFWHWHQTVNRKKGVEIPDITVDLDTRGHKPKWVYLSEEQVKKLYDAALPHYKPLIMFLYDSGVRAPSELINIKVADLFNDCKEVQIRDEVSKTFGRRIKLMISADIIKKHIEENKLKPTDYLFPVNPFSVNRYLQRLAVRVLGDVESLAGQKYSQLTMYDFRHCSCCYWLPRYKSESALKYRFGWKKSERIHYYSELLGMKDTITEEDMFLDATKTEIEKRLDKSEKEKDLLKERVRATEQQLVAILEKIKHVGELA